MNSISTTIQIIRNLEDDINMPIDKNSLMGSLHLQSSEGTDYEKRSVTMSFNSDGSVNAESLKAFNFLKVNTNLLLANAVQTTSAGLLGGLQSTTLGTTFAFLSFIGLFYSKVNYKFDKQDAGVLICVYFLGKSCAISTIEDEYKRVFAQPINETQIRKSLEVLAEYRTVKIDASIDEVTINESVTLER